MVFLGGSATGSDDKVESVIGKENVKSGRFLCVDSVTGKYKKVSAATDKIIFFVVAPGAGLGGNQASVIEDKTSTDKPYNVYEVKAGTPIPVVRRGIAKYVELGEDVAINDPIYVNPTTGLVCKSATTDGVNNIRLGNSVFTEAGLEGDIVAISFDLL